VGEARRDFKRLAVTHAERRRWIVVGLGARPEFGPERARGAAAVAHGRARELGTRTLCWEVPHHVGDDVVGGLVEGTLLRAYRFDRYKPGADSEPDLGRLILSAHHETSSPVRLACVLATAQNRARDLGNTPANDLTPRALAAYAERLPGVTVKVSDEDWIRDAGMGAFAAVARGSVERARLIELRYEGAATGPRLGLIGKAVRFDAGGLTPKIAAVGARTGERVWRLPLDQEYAEMVEGRYAQLTNRTERRGAMPITAAEFLHHFAGDLPWAHIDIAGTAWDGHRPYLDHGGTGFGTRLLVEVARAFAGE